MRFVMLIYETADDFGARSSEQSDKHTAPWRAYYKDSVDAALDATGAPLQPDADCTTVRMK